MTIDSTKEWDRHLPEVQQTLINLKSEKTMHTEKWDRRFLELAKLVANWSHDPSTKCGAVIVRADRTIASLGYNGLSRKTPDNLEFYQNREEKYSRIIHAEMNAVLALQERAVDYTLYTWPLLCCERCAVHMIQAGITRVVAPEASEDALKRWQTSLLNSLKYFREAGVATTIIK